MTYTHGHHESVLRSHKWRTVDNSAAYLSPRLTDGMSVLDLGCGPGTITADIGRRVAPGRVLGIDVSATVIEEARRDAGGGPRLVGRVVGRPHDRFRDRPSSSHRRPRDRERAPRDRRGMASLGDAPRCLLRRPPRRDPLPRVAFPRLGSAGDATVA
jgi:SAM-dependent methyltransferase